MNAAHANEQPKTVDSATLLDIIEEMAGRIEDLRSLAEDYHELSRDLDSGHLFTCICPACRCAKAWRRQDKLSSETLKRAWEVMP